MATVVVRYTPKADQADHNQDLVEAVFAELADTDPGGLRYATFRIGDRCEDGQGPNPQPATLIGSYRMLAT